MGSLLNVVLGKVVSIFRGAKPFQKFQPQFKRLYDENQVICGVHILRPKKHQRFSTHLITNGLSKGWISISKGYLAIQGDNGTVRYKIIATPGYYCCHCSKEMASSLDAVDHIRSNHLGTRSPDPSNPAGYAKLNYFDCILESSSIKEGLVSG